VESRAATGRYEAARVIDLRPAFAEVSRSSEVTSILIHVVAETFRLTPSAIVS
jgi:hypothetical protein